MHRFSFSPSNFVWSWMLSSRMGKPFCLWHRCENDAKGRSILSLGCGQRCQCVTSRKAKTIDWSLMRQPRGQAKSRERVSEERMITTDEEKTLFVAEVKGAARRSFRQLCCYLFQSRNLKDFSFLYLFFFPYSFTSFSFRFSSSSSLQLLWFVGTRRIQSCLFSISSQ
jgi:hypothetical protein